MAAAPVLPPEIYESEQRSTGWRGRAALAILLAVVVCVAVVAILCIIFWPFKQGQIVKRLEDASSSRVRLRAFHRTYFPHPGCVIDGATFASGDEAHPLITIQRLTIESTYVGILAHHVSRMIADGMRVSIPPGGQRPSFHSKPSNVSIGEIAAKDAVLEFERQGEKEPLRFDVHEISLRNVSWSHPLRYSVHVRIPTPPGEVSASGKFGVWNESDPGQTPVSGEYKLEKADLGVYHGIGGTLASDGIFSGKLSHIDVQGKTETPNFEVTKSRHAVGLRTEFNAYVDGTNGDTFLKRVDAYFRDTHLIAAGDVAGASGVKGKAAKIRLQSNQARIEDVLWLFVHNNRPPMSGVLGLRAAVEIPPGPRPFLRKVALAGSFGIVQGEFPKPSTQDSVNQLSAGARGEKKTEDPETVMTGLTGQVSLNDGLARFNDLTFGVPGAAARLRGTYSLLSHEIDLRGQMKLDTRISNTTTGVKALLLKVMDPFLKRRKRGGEILPVKIGGTYEKPQFGLDLKDGKAKQVRPPRTHGLPGYERTVPK